MSRYVPLLSDVPKFKVRVISIVALLGTRYDLVDRYIAFFRFLRSIEADGVILRTEPCIVFPVLVCSKKNQLLDHAGKTQLRGYIEGCVAQFIGYINFDLESLQIVLHCLEVISTHRIEKAPFDLVFKVIRHLLLFVRFEALSDRMLLFSLDLHLFEVVYLVWPLHVVQLEGLVQIEVDPAWVLFVVAAGSDQVFPLF